VRKSKKIRQNFLSQKYCYNLVSSFRPKNYCKKNKKLKDMWHRFTQIMHLFSRFFLTWYISHSMMHTVKIRIERRIGTEHDHGIVNW